MPATWDGVVLLGLAVLAGSVVGRQTVSRCLRGELIARTSTRWSRVWLADGPHKHQNGYSRLVPIAWLGYTGLWGGSEIRCELAVGVKASLEPRRNRCLVLGTGQKCNCAIPHWEPGLGGGLWGVPTPGTRKATGGAVLEQLRGGVGGHPTDRAKRPLMLRTPHEGNPEVIH